MNLQDCYVAFKGDYKDVMNRLPREASVIKFLKKFEENQDFAKMLEAVAANDYEQVFALSHNIKGMTANLSISALSSSISEVCECVRGGEPKSDLAPLIEKAKSDYEMTINAIKELEG